MERFIEDKAAAHLQNSQDAELIGGCLFFKRRRSYN
jgi:hypothetical protein